MFERSQIQGVVVRKWRAAAPAQLCFQLVGDPSRTRIALKRERSERIISTNKSGVAGVRCRLGPDGKPQLWMAQTRIGSQTLLKSFSVGRYG